MNQKGTPAASAPRTVDETDRLLEGLERLDLARAEGLRRAAAIQAAQAAGAERERARLRAKYGTDHPRVRSASARVAAEGRLADAVALRADEARTPAPKLDERTWVVQGRVLHARGGPAEGLTVALYFQNEGWDRSAGHACTDRTGVFVLRMEPEDLQPRQLGVSQGGELLYRDPRVLTPARMTVEAHVVVLPAQVACAPPERPGVEVPDGSGPGQGIRPGDPGRDRWTVRGTVTDAAGQPAAGLTVSLYDRDLLFDDRLGTTTTDDAGRYRFSYRTADFRDFIERRPDLYVKVLDAQGRTLHSTRAKVRYEAGREEVIDVTLPAQRER